MTFKGNAGSARQVAYGPNGKRIASLHTEPPGTSEYGAAAPPSDRPGGINPLREVLLWDADTGQIELSLNKGTYTWSIAFFPDGRRLAGAVASSVRIWDTSTGNERLVLNGHTDVVHDLAISRDGKRLATASADGTVKVWDPTTGACLRTLKGDPQGVFHVSISPDGRRVAYAGVKKDGPKEIWIWDVATGKQVLAISPSPGEPAFSPDGKRLASFDYGLSKAGEPGHVQVWNASSGEHLFVSKGHSEHVSCMAYSADGKRLASGSYDGTVIVWDAITGERLLSLAAHGHGKGCHEVTSVAFRPDGQRLATASDDGDIKVWDVQDIMAGNGP